MEWEEEEIEEQRSFDNNNFDPHGSEFQHTGTWPAPQFPPAEEDDPALDLGHFYDLDETPEIPPFGQLAATAAPYYVAPTTSYYVGLETGRLAPQIEISQHGDVSSNLSNRGQAHDGYEQSVPHQTYGQQAQDVRHITSQPSAPSQYTSGTSATRSSYCPGTSIISSGGEPERMTTRTSASISRPGSSNRERKEHPCPKCGKIFDRPSDLKKHMRKYLPEHERPIQCEVCGKGCLFPKELRRHMLTHSDRQFRCDDCGKEYTRRDNRDRHQKKCPPRSACDYSRARSTRKLSTSSSQRSLRPNSDQSQVAGPKLTPVPATPEMAAGLMYGRDPMTASRSNQSYTPVERNLDSILRSSALPTVREGAYEDFSDPFMQPPSYILSCNGVNPSTGHGEDNVSNVSQLQTPPQSVDAAVRHPQVYCNAVGDTYQAEFQSPPSPSPVARPPGNNNRRLHFD